MGFGNGIGSGIMLTLGADTAPSLGRVKFLGLWRVLSDSGAAAGPVLVSVLATLWTLAAGIVGVGFVGLLAAGFARDVGSEILAVRDPTGDPIGARSFGFDVTGGVVRDGSSRGAG